MGEEMARGVVKWFNAEKGYGFIVSDEKGPDVFCHYSAIIDQEGYKSLNDNDPVEYEVAKGPKGLVASQVRKI